MKVVNDKVAMYEAVSDDLNNVFPPEFTASLLHAYRGLTYLNIHQDAEEGRDFELRLGVDTDYYVENNDPKIMFVITQRRIPYSKKIEKIIYHDLASRLDAEELADLIIEYADRYGVPSEPRAVKKQHENLNSQLFYDILLN